VADAKYNPATEESITLTLSVAEASFLAAVLDLVGGSPTNSPRRYAPPIINALSSAGVERMDASTLSQGRRIQFGDDETPTPETFKFEGQTLRYGVLYRDCDGDEAEFRYNQGVTERRWRWPGGGWGTWHEIECGSAPYTEIIHETFDFEGQILKYGTVYLDRHGDETEFRRGGPTGTEFRWRNPGRNWSEWISFNDGCPPYQEKS
jgi:hypothetical protein